MEAFPCRQAASLAVAKTLLEGIILTWGLLLELHDKSTIALDKFQMLLVKSSLQHFCCTHQPQSSGQMERTNVCVCVCVCLVALSWPTLCDPVDCSLPGPRPWNFPGKNTGVGCHFLPQGIFLTQGSNSHLLCLMPRQAESLPLCATRKPKELTA